MQADSKAQNEKKKRPPLEKADRPPARPGISCTMATVLQSLQKQEHIEPGMEDSLELPSPSFKKI